MRAELEEESFEIVLAGEVGKEIGEIPGARFDAEQEAWVLPLSWASCVQLREVLGETLEIGSRLARWAADERARVDRARTAREATDGPTPQLGEASEFQEDESVRAREVEKQWWFELWQGMPEYLNYDVSPWRTVKVHFRNRKDLEEFQRRMGFKVTKFPVGTGTTWYPPGTERGNEWRYVDEENG